MVRDAAATRQRLLDAATEEFAARGIAGARVDRIASVARSNKAQIYHYFGSKNGLFDAVFDRIVQATVSETPIDPTDLPQYAGRLFDRYQRHPEIQRLATWYRLERADGNHPIAAIVASNGAKVKAIAGAQQAGLLSSRFEPAVLLALVADPLRHVVLDYPRILRARQPTLDCEAAPGDRRRRRNTARVGENKCRRKERDERQRHTRWLPRGREQRASMRLTGSATPTVISAAVTSPSSSSSTSGGTSRTGTPR